MVFNQDQSQVESTKNVTFTENLGTGFNLASVSDLTLPTTTLTTTTEGGSAVDSNKTNTNITA